MTSVHSNEAPLPLDRLTTLDAIACGRVLRQMSGLEKNRQAVAERIVKYFYESFRSAETGEPSCVLARCFQTSSYAGLPMDYQFAADKMLDDIVSDARMRCLSLLATRGDKTTWNDVVTSQGHQAIPLPSVEVVNRAPMIARLLEQLNVSVERIVDREENEPLLLDTPSSRFNVFHVEDAMGSPYIPAQDQFVKPAGVKSVVGLGGFLPGGDFFAVILFTRVTIHRPVAELFRALAEAIQEALTPFDNRHVFRGSGLSQ